MILVDATLFGFSDAEWNHHKANHYNIDGWLQRMMPYWTDPVAYAEKARKNSPLSPEDAEMMYQSSLQIPPFVGLEYHLDTYFTDNMTPLRNRTIPGSDLCHGFRLPTTMSMGIRPRGHSAADQFPIGAVLRIYVRQPFIPDSGSGQIQPVRSGFQR